MKSRLLHLGFCFLLVLAMAPLAAQLTPVRVDVRLFQPSVYPEDLSLPGAAAVSVTLTDMDRASLPGYLRLTLSNNSGQEITTPLVAETRVDLTPFNTVTFTGPGLERFVRLLGADAGAMGGSNGLVLAEGEVELCAEFYDLDFPFAGPISNPNLNCSFGFAELHEPPTPFFPVDEEVVAIDPLQDAVNFTWTPNYFAGPVINYLTVWDVPREWAGVTPDIIMTSLEPIRQPLRVNELNALNKVWYTSDADLIPGHRYLYQIQATDPTGRARFRNNGYSRPVFFDYVSPTPFTDRRCYEPERLALNGESGNYKLFWTGYPIDSVNHTLTVLTLPERRFVQQTELLTTPTFPARRPVNGGPLTRFSYDINSNLDTTAGRAYLVTLCSVCPLTGEEFCEEIVLGNSRETGPDGGPDPMDSTLVCGLYPEPDLTITDLTATTATVGWEELPTDFTGSFVLSWAGPENSGIPADSIALSAITRSQVLTTLTGNTGYTATLCVVCPDGARSCFSEPFVTPADDCPTEDDILAGVTVSALPPDRIVVDWSGAVPGSDPNGWSATISDGSEESASETDLASPTFTAPAAAPTDTSSDFEERTTASSSPPTSTTFSALDPSSSYVVTVCYACPGDSTVCANWPVDLSGSAECLTSLNFTRPDSTDTTLDLAWSYDPNTVSATDSFTLNWQLADGGGPEHTATLAYAAAAFTITDRTPGEAYTLRVCAECTVAQTTCRDLPPFGGCVAEYLPELVDLRGRRALLSWNGDDRNLETEVRYGMRNLGGGVIAQPVNSQHFTAANYDRPEDQLVQTERLYAMTYVGQARTACADTLWSEWSEPILFSPSCALALTDSLYVWEITDSSALVTGQVMPQARNYVFSYRQAGSSEWILSTDRSTPDLLLTELSADTEYEVKMRYRCGAGVRSNFSQVFTFRTLTPCAAPENISFADVTASSAVISWTSGNYAETTLFRYRIAGGSGAWQTVTFAGNSGTLTELAPGEAYEIEAVSHCAANSSYVSAPQTLVLDCAPPELRVTAITVSSAQLQAFGLSPAAASNGFAYRVVGAADWILIDSAYLTGLDDLTEYEARARTTCTSGEASDWSDPVRFGTPVDCRVPDELGVTSLSTGSAGLRWATTGSNERWEIRLLEEGAAGRVETLEQTATIGIEDIGGGFDVESGGGIYGGGGVYNNPTPPDPYADWRLITSDSPEVLVEGLKAYTDYRIVVRTYCPTNGWTDYSEDLLLRTLCATQPADSLYADQILEDRARLRFQPDTRCQIENEIVLEHPETLYSDASTQSVWYHTFTNLEPNTVYRFKVRTKAESYAFTPAANGYTTMADVGTSTGSAGAADAGARVVGEAGWTAFSAWQTFRTDDCAVPYDFVENTLDQSTIEITWAASNGINTYEFKYKLADDLGSDWAYLNVSEPYVRLENILRGTLYDYQVTELCQNGETFRPAPQDTFLLKRASRNNGFYACGVESDVDLSNEVPLGSLAEGDTITAFDFPVVITSVSGSGGNFSGEGEIRVPYFNKAKATFSFDGIFVNDDYQMKGGKLVAIGAGVEVLPPWADELLAEVMGALQMLDSYLEDEQLELMDSLMSCCSATLPAELRQRIFDLQNCYAAQAEQDTPNYSLCADMLEALMADIQAFLDAIYGGTFQVAFAAAPDQTYGFDRYNDGDGGRRQNWYETDTLAKEPYPIAFKSIKAGGSDQVLAEIPASDGSPNVYQDSVGYELPTGTIPSYSYPGTSATTATITVTDASGTDDNFFLAATQIDPDVDTVPPFIAGLLDVIPYEELTPTLRIIETTPGALAGLDRDAVEQRIRDIYAQAIVKPSVEYVRFAEAGDYIPQDYEAPLQAVPSGWLTPYTQQMKAFRRNYLDQETPEDDEYIFFVFGKNASGEDSFEPTDRLGFMPPGRRFSFIYRNESKNTNVADFGRTIAHELGHGAYVLRHPWTENDDRYVAQGNSRNLMDESGGTELWKWQWDLIHDPEGAPFLPGDEDGEYVVPTNIASLRGLRQSGVFVFSDPTGAPIVLPGDINGISFYSGDELSDEISLRNTSGVSFKILPVASVRNFTLADNSVYVPKYAIEGENITFLGYCKVSEEGIGDCISSNDLVPNVEIGGESGIDSIGLAFPCYDNGRIGMWTGLVERSQFSSIASGSRLVMSYDALISLYREIGTGFTTVVANTYTGAEGVSGLTAEAEQFLNFLSDKINTCNSPASAYAFVHAHQISKYPDFYRNCEGLVFDQLVQTTQDWVDYIKKKALSLSILPISPSTTLMIAYYQEADEGTILSGEEVEVWKNADVSFYHYFSEESVLSQPPSSEFWMGLKADEPNSDDHARKLVFEFMNAFDSPCQFQNLNISNRVKALRLLSELDLEEDNLFEVEWNSVAAAIPGMVPYFFNDDTPTEKLFNIVLGSGSYTKSQAELIIRLFKSAGTTADYDTSNGFYYQVVDQMFDSDFLNDPNYEQFAGILASIFFKSTVGRPEILYESNIDGTTHILPPAGVQLASDKVLHLPNCCSTSIDNTTTSQSFFSSSSVMDRVNIKHQLRSVKFMNGSQVSDQTTVSHDVKGNPFEYVVIVNYQERISFTVPSGENLVLSPGDTLIVPMFLAQSYYQKFETAEIKLKLRIGIDIVTTCVSFGTASAAVGGWRLLSLADAAYSAIDIAFAADEYDMALTGEGTFPQELHQIWAGIGIGLVVANTTQFVRTVAGANVSRIRMRMIDEWVEHVRTSANSFDEYLAVISDTKNRTRQFIYVLENASDAPASYNWRADEYDRLIRDSKAAYVALSEAMAWRPPINIDGIVVLRSKHRLDLGTPFPGLVGDTYAGFMGPSASAPLSQAWYYGPVRYIDDSDAVLLSERMRWSVLPDPNLRGIRTGLVQGTSEALATFAGKLMIYRNVLTGRLEYYAAQVEGVDAELVTTFNICQRYGLNFDVYQSSISQYLSNKNSTFIRLWADKLDELYFTYGRTVIVAFFDEIIRSSNQNLLNYFGEEALLTGRMQFWTQLYVNNIISGIRKRVHWVFHQDVDGLFNYLKSLDQNNQQQFAHLYDSWPDGQAGLERSNALRAAILDASSGLGTYLETNVGRAVYWDIIAGDLTNVELALAKRPENIDALTYIAAKFKSGEDSGVLALQEYFSYVPANLAYEAVEQIKVSNQLEAGTDYTNAVGSYVSGTYQVELIGMSTNPAPFRGVKYYSETSLPTVAQFNTALEELGGIYRDINPSGSGHRMVLGRDPAVEWGYNFPTQANSLDIHVHGDYDPIDGAFYIYIKKNDSKLRVKLTPYQLADHIKNINTYNDIEVVRLYACYGIGGGQEIANILDKPVITGTEPISVYPNGDMYISGGTLVKYVSGSEHPDVYDLFLLEGWEWTLYNRDLDAFFTSLSPIEKQEVINGLRAIPDGGPGNPRYEKLQQKWLMGIPDQGISPSAYRSGFRENPTMIQAFDIVRESKLIDDLSALNKIANHIDGGADLNRLQLDFDDIFATEDVALLNRWVNTLGDPNYLVLRRGTDLGQENNFFAASGYILSDAAKYRFYELNFSSPPPNMSEVLQYSEGIHQQYLGIFNGDIDAYAQAHALEGTNMEDTYGLKRTLISTTNDPLEVGRFYTPGVGSKYIGIFQKNEVVRQTLFSSGESEYLLINGSNLMKKIIE